MSVHDSMKDVHWGKLVAFFQRSLVMLPQAFQEYDSSHVSLIYMAVLGLTLLCETPKGDLRKQIIEYIGTHRVSSLEGFRGSLTHARAGPAASEYDPAHLTATYFCLSILAMLDAPHGLDYQAVLDHVRRCQTSSGQFCAIGVSVNSNSKPSLNRVCGEGSHRHTFAALAILKFLGMSDETLERKAVASIHSCQCYDGGYSDSPFGESHAGLTFCCVSSLAILGRQPLNEAARSFLVHRQLKTGGFNGRVNKNADPCYTFWVCEALATGSALSLCDVEAAAEYLASVQEPITGGFAKAPEAPPDLLHTALTVAVFALFRANGLEIERPLEEIDPVLSVPKRASDYAEKHW